MICPYCKNEISLADSAFCPDCGNALEDTAVAPSSDATSRSKRVLLIGLGGCVGIFIVLLCLPGPSVFMAVFLLGMLSVFILFALPVFLFLRFIVRLFKNRFVGIGCVVGTLGLIILLLYYSPSELYDRYLQPDTCIKKASKTTITAHLEEPIGTENNIIYCGAFQKAWDKLHDDVFKEDIQLASHPVMAQKLNKQLLRSKDLSEDSYVAEAGPWTSELVARINRKMQEKFGEDTDSGSIAKAPDDRPRIIAYAYLYKKLEFPTKFEKLSDPILFEASGAQTPLKAFGIHFFSTSNEVHRKLSDQVRVLHYRTSDDFAISFISKSKDDEIILAKLAPGESLLETYQKATTVTASTSTNLVDGETLRVPKVDFGLTRHFSEIEHKDILNPGWSNWFIEAAEQQIKFTLDETGAVVRSRVFLAGALKEEAPAPTSEPRRFVFDKPFLICMKQKNGNLPYFCMWVNNPELMVRP